VKIGINRYDLLGVERSLIKKKPGQQLRSMTEQDEAQNRGDSSVTHRDNLDGSTAPKTHPVETPVHKQDTTPRKFHMKVPRVYGTALGNGMSAEVVRRYRVRKSAAMSTIATTSELEKVVTDSDQYQLKTIEQSPAQQLNVLVTCKLRIADLNHVLDRTIAELLINPQIRYNPDEAVGQFLNSHPQYKDLSLFRQHKRMVEADIDSTIVTLLHLYALLDT